MPKPLDGSGPDDSAATQLELLRTISAQEARIKELEGKYAKLKKRARYLALPYAVLLSPVLLPAYLYRKIKAPKRQPPRTMGQISGRRADVAPPRPDPAHEADLAGEADTFVLYRIIGNNLVPRHAEGQSYRNVEFILENEPAFENCTKRWVLNRLFDADERARIIELLEARGQQYSEIPFSWEDYAGIGYDFEAFEPGFFQSGAFQSLDDEEKVRARVHSYRLKNAYVMNNNGARNFALEEGRRLAKWVLPWDGNCFLTAEAWGEIARAVRARKDMRYLVVPMARITDNRHLLLPDFRPEAEEEPQILFRRDAGEAFNERCVYGRRPKVELLMRLGEPGPWETWRLDPWDEPPRRVCPDAHLVDRAGWVARLFSGKVSGEIATTTGFKDRGRMREEAILRTIDLVDALRLDRIGVTRETPHFYDPAALGAIASEDPSPWRDSVLARADAALERGIYTILDKTTLPPSNDPHDYWHPAPYWWPNPKSGDGLPYVKKDGERVPGTEVFGPGSEKYDRTRLQHLFDDVTYMAMAWTMTRNDAYRAHALALLRAWFVAPETRMTPSLAYAQVRMGHEGNQGQSWGLIESKDMYYFLDAVRLLGPSEETEGLRDWTRAFLSWLGTSDQGRKERRAGNNHGTCYDLQVAALAAFTGDTGALTETLHRAQSRIAAQFTEDGQQPEEMRRTLTQHYCAFNLQSWINLFGLYERLGFAPWSFPEAARIERALEWFLAESEGTWRHKQIAPFDARRLEPLRQAGRRHGIVAGAAPDFRAAPLVAFHADDGIAPFWELSAIAGGPDMRDAG